MSETLIECTVAPGRTVYGAHPSGIPGAEPYAFTPGQTVRVSPTEAAHMREAGFLLLEDGTQAQRTV